MFVAIFVFLILCLRMILVLVSHFLPQIKEAAVVSLPQELENI